LKEVDPPEPKCESDSSKKGGYGSESKDKKDDKNDLGLPDWGYAEHGRDWPDKYPKCALPQ